jgi:hypothetical protein
MKGAQKKKGKKYEKYDNNMDNNRRYRSGRRNLFSGALNE